MTRVRFGVIGAGRIARNAVGPAILASRNATLHAAASRDIARARALKPTRAYSSYDDLLNDDEVDAVYIATHNGLHKSITLAALTRGKHVLCEKPLAVSAIDCEEMLRAAKAANRHLVEAFMYRHHPQLSKVQGLLESKAIGDLMVVEASFRFPLKNHDDVRLQPEWGGGALLDVGCYCVNVSRLFLGSDVVRISALASFHQSSGVDMSVQGVLDYGNGRYAIVSCGFDAGRHQKVHLVGTDGVIQLNEPFNQPTGQPQITLTTSRHQETIQVSNVNTFQLEVEDLADAILNDSQPLLPPSDALANARVLDAIARAVRARETP
ncbi:MAG: Gfo/Idh/MocA family oxidoreductase [Gemmatimonadota bacterium]